MSLKILFWCACMWQACVMPEGLHVGDLLLLTASSQERNVGWRERGSETHSIMLSKPITMTHKTDKFPAVRNQRLLKYLGCLRALAASRSTTNLRMNRRETGSTRKNHNNTSTRAEHLARR